MALEQITGLNFGCKGMFQEAAEDAATDLRAALYNSTHFEIPCSFDVSTPFDTGERYRSFESKIIPSDIFRAHSAGTDKRAFSGFLGLYSATDSNTNPVPNNSACYKPLVFYSPNSLRPIT